MVGSFEVERTTAIYSGLLRIAALLAAPIVPRLIHADGRFASYSSLKRESFPVVARDESKQPVDRPRRRRFTQRVTHVPRQGIEFVRCSQREVWELAPVFARVGE